MTELVAKPEMLTLGRECRGLSQERLAELAGVSQGYLSKGENGFIEVTGDRLDAIGRALDYPTEFFALDEHKAGIEALFHRRLRTVKVAELKQIQAQINVTRVQVKKLLSGITIDTPYSFPRLDVDEIGGPEQAAQLVRRAWRIPLGPVPNVVGAIEAAGGVVMPITISTERVSAAAQWPVGEHRPYFFVNAAHSGDRQRFSLAHEVGHMVLHAYPEQEQEDQADRFASEFLMPAAEIRPQLRGRLTPARLADLKRYWKVSMAALIRRANQLEIIDKTKMTSLYKMLSARGWRKNEPAPIEPELPGVVPDVLAIHRNTHHYSDEDLARLTRLRVPEFRRLFAVLAPSADGPGAGIRRLRAVG
jgi:Zn-dependent peptidase ImmA (M78 family)/transcriptional regulator with XRE-family HTH domain